MLPKIGCLLPVHRNRRQIDVIHTAVAVGVAEKRGGGLGNLDYPKALIGVAWPLVTRLVNSQSKG